MDGSTLTLDKLCAEIVRLRAELAKAKRALERAGFVDNGGQEWKPPLGPSASPLLDEIDRLRSELAKASAEVQRLTERNTQVEEEASRYLDKLNTKDEPKVDFYAMPKDAPPADVLGEAFRSFVERAWENDNVPGDIYSAVLELAKVVERIARAQRGGK